LALAVRSDKAALRQHGNDGRDAHLGSFFDHQVKTGSLRHSHSKVQANGTLPPLRAALDDLGLDSLRCHRPDPNTIGASHAIDHIDQISLPVTTHTDVVGLVVDEYEAIPVDVGWLDEEGS
jgi:hypothetical protein